MTRCRLMLILAGVTLALGASAARSDSDHDVARRLRESGIILPLETILETHRDRYRNGRILETELGRRGGLYVYELKILASDGTVRELEFDASSGELLEIEDKRIEAKH